MSGTFNRPRLRLLVNGMPFTVISAEVSQTGYYRASKFHAVLALYGSAAAPPSFWTGTTTYDVEIQGGYLADGAPEGAASWVSLFKGTADEDIDAHMDNGTVTIAGRDYSGKLMDAKTAETFANQTASQIATTLAKRVGLAAEISSTSQLAGQFYQLDHARTSHDQFSKSTSYWELITYLAQQEGYDVWVDGSTLHMAPKDQNPGLPVFTVTNLSVFGQDGSLINRQCNVQSLTLSRRPALSKDIQVTVKSWGGKRKAMVTGKSGPNSAEQTVVRTFPNLSAAQCQARAASIRAELGRHERSVHFSMPGEFTMRPRQPIAIKGTGTEFDATFFISEIDREFSFDGGFWQSVTARNIPPADDQAIP